MNGVFYTLINSGEVNFLLNIQTHHSLQKIVENVMEFEKKDFELIKLLISHLKSGVKIL